MWCSLTQYRLKSQTDLRESGSVEAAKDSMKPMLKPSIHEIVIRNQLMAVEPPLELARVNWVRSRDSSTSC